MALYNYAQVWNQVLLRAPDVGPMIAQNLVRNAFLRVAERRRWSWLIKFGQFISPAVYNTGTVTVTQGSATVTGSGTAWTSALLYRQFRIGLTAPIYTIQSVDSATQITLDSAYGSTTASGAVYQIYQCFYSTPSDYHSMLTLWDPQMNWQLYLNVKQEELNLVDAQRATMGNAYCVSYRDTSTLTTNISAGQPGVPRLELWPHATARVFPFLYEARATDLIDSGALLPRYIRGDMLLEMALAECANYPGTRDKPNAYFNRQTAQWHAVQGERFINEAERQDDETDMQDLMRQYSVPPALAVPWGDAAWIQSHAIA